MKRCEKVKAVLKHLSYFNDSFPSVHMRASGQLLDQFSHDLQTLEGMAFTEPQKLEQIYLLLMIYTGLLYQVIGRRDWAVEKLIQMLEETCQDPLMPALIKQDHLLKRGLLLYQSLTWGQSISLGQEAVQRFSAIFNMPFPLSFDRKIKLTLGNIFSGFHNTKILAHLFPHLLALSLPYGKLHGQFRDGLNALLTDLISAPRVNGDYALITQHSAEGQEASLEFDFATLRHLLLSLSDKRILLSLGETPESLDVRVLQALSLLIRQISVIISRGQPSRLEIILQERPILGTWLKNVLSDLQALRPVYTWGNALDLALNELMEALKNLSGECLKVIAKPLSAPAEPQRMKSWDVLRFLKEPSHAISRTIDQFYELVDIMMPKISASLHKFMPENKIALLIEKAKPPVYAIIDQSLALNQAFQRLGLYHEITQDFLAPFREHLFSVNLEFMQAALAIYKRQLEPVMFRLINDQSAAVWKEMNLQLKNELVLNAAGFIFRLRKCFVSVLPLMDPRCVLVLRQALSVNQEVSLLFEGLIGQVIQLQQILKQDAEPLLEQAIGILAQESDMLTAGSATQTAVKQSYGTVVGVVAGRTVDALSFFELNLGYVPSKSDLLGIPLEWENKTLKTILKNELTQTQALIKQVNSLDYQSPLIAPSPVRQAAVTML